MTRNFIAGAVFFAAAVLTVFPAHAQTAPPAPTASPAPIRGFSATGTLAVDAQMSPGPIHFDATVGVMNGGRKVRIDLIHIAMSGADSGAGAMMANFLPGGVVSVVYDQSAGTMTIWSVQKRLYYQTKISAFTPKPSKTKAAPKKAAANNSPIDSILRGTKSFTEYDTFTQSLSLVGHQPINGHTSSVFHFTMQAQKHGGKLQDTSGDLAFADDLSGIPVRFWIDTKGEVSASMHLDLTSASLQQPPASAFAVPAGYKKARSPMELLGSSTPAH